MAKLDGKASGNERIRVSKHVTHSLILPGRRTGDGDTIETNRRTQNYATLRSWEEGKGDL